MAVNDDRSSLERMAWDNRTRLVMALIGCYCAVIGSVLPDLIRIFGYLAIVFPKAFGWAVGWHDRLMHVPVLSVLVVGGGVAYTLFIGLSVAAYILGKENQ